jgi:hypothetical protein
VCVCVCVCVCVVCVRAFDASDAFDVSLIPVSRIRRATNTRASNCGLTASPSVRAPLGFPSPLSSTDRNRGLQASSSGWLPRSRSTSAVHSLPAAMATRAPRVRNGCEGVCLTSACAGGVCCTHTQRCASTPSP